LRLGSFPRRTSGNEVPSLDIRYRRSYTIRGGQGEPVSRGGRRVALWEEGEEMFFFKYERRL